MRERLEWGSNPDLFNSGAVHFQLSYQANWELLHIHISPLICKQDFNIPKQVLFDEIADLLSTIYYLGHPCLRQRELSKTDLENCGITLTRIYYWETNVPLVVKP